MDKVHAPGPTRAQLGWALFLLGLGILIVLLFGEMPEGVAARRDREASTYCQSIGYPSGEFLDAIERIVCHGTPQH